MVQTPTPLTRTLISEHFGPITLTAHAPTPDMPDGGIHVEFMLVANMIPLELIDSWAARGFPTESVADRVHVEWVMQARPGVSVEDHINNAALSVIETLVVEGIEDQIAGMVPLPDIVQRH